MDKNKHLFYMRKLLREFYSDELLASELRFKGGTAAMLFEGLPRFSTDLDFNLVHRSKQEEVFNRIREIALRNGKIADCADKRFGPIVVLDYGAGDRNLKIEVSNRMFDSHYVMRDFASGIIPVMVQADMLSHKLCALQARKAPRDIFDVWYFMSKGWPVNDNIIKERSMMDIHTFLGECLNVVDGFSSKSIMSEIGELLDGSMKDFVREKLLFDLKGFIEDFMDYPYVSELPLCDHTRLLFEKDSLLPCFKKNSIDPSTVSNKELSDILSGKRVSLRDTKGINRTFRQFGDRFVVSTGLGI